MAAFPKGQRSAPVPPIVGDVREAASARTESLMERIRWVQLESEDNAVLARNLRAVECPEETIIDILRARIGAAYRAKIADVANPLAAYWRGGEAAQAAVNALLREESALLAALGPTDGELPPEKEAHIEEARRKFPLNYPPLGSSDDQWRAALEARKARIEYLSQFLTPEELI